MRPGRIWPGPRSRRCSLRWPTRPRLLAAAGIEQRRVLLIGGAAQSEAVCRIAPGIFGTPVLVPESEEYVALGAARQAAWALAQTADPPGWPRHRAAEYSGPAEPEVRERHAALRDDTAAWL